MIFFNGVEIPKDKSDISCYWCRYPFKTAPWFCPVKFNQVSKIYEVDGVFCSRECTNAYLYENSNNLLYKDSRQLLSLMYAQNTGHFHKKNLDRAPSWKLLQAYGGDMTIEQFRSSFDTVDIIATDSIERPFQCYPVSYEFSIHQKWGL
tara:strand:+ start:2244 stop:2690 length:447 start_codon:yes stop_codon:yes gene_type:complete